MSAVDGWLAVLVADISWLLWNPALGTVCGVLVGRAVVALIEDMLP